MDIINEAIERAPDAYSTYPPTVGQLRVLCEQVHAQVTYGLEERRTQANILEMHGCGHHFVWEDEPEGSFFLGFDTCVKCGLTKPKISNNPKHKEMAAIFAAGIKGGKRRSSQDENSDSMQRIFA